MTLPDAYLVGAPKAGTTSLAEWLAAHPDVYFSVPKEPFHWARDYPAMRRHYGFEDRADYESLFSSSAATGAQRRMEGSTTYLYSAAAVPDILAAVDRPKFVVSVRNPVDLLVSYHRNQLVATNETEPDFEAAWRRSLRGEPPDTTPLDDKLVDYARVGRLGAAVARLSGLVPPGDLHVVNVDRIASEPAAVWAELVDFLGLSPAFTPQFTRRNASDKMYRSALLHRVTQRPPAALTKPVARLRQWSRTTDNPVVARAKRAMWRPEQRPSISPAMREELREFFADDVALLGETLHLDLSAWVSTPGLAAPGSAVGTPS